MRSKYLTHNIFKKGDIILMDQFSSLHRRTPITDVNRVLWRIACDYSTIMPNAWYPLASLDYPKGNEGSLLNRDKEVKKIISNLMCLKINKSGQPTHPLYQKKDLKLIKYS
jgi:hypothetical protein